MNSVIVLGSVFAVHVLAMMSPGPNVLIVTQMAVSQSRRAALFTALGVAAGAALWAGAALIGLSVVFARLPWFYVAIRLLGGIYLIYLGIKIWRTAGEPLVASTAAHPVADTQGRAFRLGLLTNLTNPKAVVFFGSIFAALLTPDSPVWIKLAAITIIVVDASAWHGALACLFSTKHAQQLYGRFKRWCGRIAGGVMVVLGLRLAVVITKGNLE